MDNPENIQFDEPKLSDYFESLEPSDIRLAALEFGKRTDGARAVNVAIGNVSLPAHPAIQRGIRGLGVSGGPLEDGVVPYPMTVGIEKARLAIARMFEANGCSAKDLFIQVTDGGSQAMERMIVGCCGRQGLDERPLVTLDPTYTNYKTMVRRLGRKVVSAQRQLRENGKFTLPDVEEVRRVITETRAGALLIIPCDNPTGQAMKQSEIDKFAEVCVDSNIWLAEDGAYRGLNYDNLPPASVWKSQILGIKGRRISIESFSKVTAACGVHMGGHVTDSRKFHERAVADQTINLCANVLGQHAVSAIADETPESLSERFRVQREYYKPLMDSVVRGLKEMTPGLIVSSPDASLYSVLDVRNIAKPGFDAKDFVLYCAREGGVDCNGKITTLLLAPMAGFYNIKEGEENPGKTQMRIAYILSPEEMALVPRLFKELFQSYEAMT